jgi:hypothetical protein
MYHESKHNQKMQNILWIIIIAFVFLIKLIFSQIVN